MSKKHFKALAAALADQNPALHPHSDWEVQQRQWKADVFQVAGVCAQFNPRFDRARFLAACGVTAEGQ